MYMLYMLTQIGVNVNMLIATWCLTCHLSKIRIWKQSYKSWKNTYEYLRNINCRDADGFIFIYTSGTNHGWKRPVDWL